jgi:hypothetical protein
MSQDPPPPPPSPYDGTPQPAVTNTRARWSLLLGFVSIPLTCLCGIGVVLGIAAIVLGWRSKDAPSGRAMALGGIASGAISVVVLAVFLVLHASGAINEAPRG